MPNFHRSANMANEPDSALTGAAFELANAGYASMPDPKKKGEEEAFGSDSASLREAAERHAGPANEIVVRAYTDSDGKPVAANEAITLARAARDYADATTLDKFAVENESGKELAARVDALRAEALARDSDAAEFYGFEPPPAKADKTVTDKTATDKIENLPGDPAEKRSDRAATGLDPELEKALQHPQVLQAIEEKIGEAQKTRQSYLDGLAAATQIAQVSFLSQFPELAGVPPESLPGALEQMSRHDPQKFARVQAMISHTEQLFAQQRQESHRQAETARQNFHTYATSEDARLETMLKGESKETQRAVSAEIIASAKASGVEPAELFKLYSSEPLMRNAVFQRMMYDAGKYRLMMKAKDAATTKPVPPVQRPGVARTAAEREHTDMRSLNARLSTSGNIKDAVALYNARKSTKR
jgi:hypothetical protein